MRLRAARLPRALVALLLLACEGDPPAPGALRGSVPDEPLWVMTYNVNFERPSNETVDAILEADADVVLLQEVTPDFARRIQERLADRYPIVRIEEAEDEGGMAVLSRYPIQPRAHPPAPRAPFPAGCFTVSGTPLGDLDILHVHLHPPLDDDGRLVTGFFTTGDLRREELEHHLACFDGAPDIVAGDFNEGEGDAVEHLRALGMQEAQRAHEPVERTWTWEDSFTDLRGRPDHIFVESGLSAAAVQVMEIGGSDHRPLRTALTRTGDRR